MIDPAHQEEHSYINALCDHLGVEDVTGTHALFIANGWTQPLDFGRGQNEVGISRQGLEYLLSVATRNKELLSQMLSESRKVFP
ncbi:hypothetical protein [Rothia terrae]|uniref:Uncharacterized protein n=1 Tax=Rothia terrae TaxID=396015 RepID=A0A7H2BD07_9MICC|nr:hypothetical protein [Rothia terrae]QNV37553.1 hypothetical protein IDM49_10115 [Rothia terrae]